MLLMVLGDQVFCLCKLRHSDPDNNCHGPKGRSGSLNRGPVDRKGNQTPSPEGHSGSLNRVPDGHSGSLNCGRSRPREGCCPRSSSRSSSRSGSLTWGPVDRKISQTQRPDGHSGSLSCPRSSCRRSCSRSHSESRPTRCRQYQHCQGGKFVTIMCHNDELS